MAAAIGVTSAISALVYGSAIGQDLEIAAVSTLISFGVLLSWLLVHTGFADLYDVMDRSSGRKALGFPGEAEESNLKYLYLAITVGTPWPRATSRC